MNTIKELSFMLIYVLCSACLVFEIIRDFYIYRTNKTLAKKHIIYKPEPKYLVKEATFKSKRHIELVIMNYGLYNIIKCSYDDLEIS